MLIQAEGYAKPTYPYTCYESLYLTTRQHVGGCLWHSFDHQRGYHPGSFLRWTDGCIPPTEIFVSNVQGTTQPGEKWFDSRNRSDGLHCSRNDSFLTERRNSILGIATRYASPCFKVASSISIRKRYAKKECPRLRSSLKMCSMWWMTKTCRARRDKAKYSCVAEGIIDGKVVATHKVTPARRPSKVILWADNEGMNFEANGSDLVTVVAAIADGNGNIKAIEQLLHPLRDRRRRNHLGRRKHYGQSAPDTVGNGTYSG